MRENLRCNCHICRVERHLFTVVEQFPGADRFRKITTTSPVLATFADARTLIGHLHAQKRGEYNPPSPSEVLQAIIEAGRNIGDPEMSQSVLVLAFMPTIHRTYREIRAWFQELCTEDIAQQTFLLFLELAASTAAGLLGGQLSFALARSLHRNTLRWARKEQLMLFEEDRFREEQQRAAEPSEDAYFEPASLLEDFLDYCVRREIISAFERALLLKIKVDGFVAKEAADTHTVLSPKAVHMRIQRIMKKLQEATGRNVIEMKLPKRLESVGRKQRKHLSKSASNFSLSMSTGNVAIGKSRRQLSLDIPPRQVTAKAQQFSTRKQDSLALFPSLTLANERTCVVRGAASRRLADRLAKWTTGGQFDFVFDNAEDTITFSRFQCFDFQGMNQYPEVLEPLLFYILHRANAVIGDPNISHIFKAFFIDEAWLFLKNPIIKSYIIEALKTWRKQNAAMILSTQSLDELRKSEILDIIVESCSTKIFLANPDMDRDLYRRQFNLNDNEIELISTLRPKQQLLIKTPELAKVSTVQLLAWFPVLLITFLASIYALLKVPVLTNHIFSGASGGSSGAILGFIAGRLKA